MSVEKVTALPNKVTVSEAPPRGGESQSRFPMDESVGTTPEFVISNSGTHVESLVLPIVDAAPSAGTPEVITRAAYNSWLSTTARPVTLVDGQINTETVIREVKILLQRKADEQNISIKRLLHETTIAPHDSRPSVNAADAVFSMQTQLYDPSGGAAARLIDFYLTRVNKRQWEVTAFWNDPARGGFPYATVPMKADRIVIDPSTGEILACVAMKISPSLFSDRSGFRLETILVTTAGAVIILGLLFKMPLLVAILFLIAAMALAFSLRWNEN